MCSEFQRSTCICFNVTGKAAASLICMPIDGVMAKVIMLVIQIENLALT